MVSASPVTRSLQVADFGCIRNGRVLLRHIDFGLHSGEVLLLKGSNGTGKSTLLRSLAGLMTWRAGELSWCGQPVAARHPSFQQQLVYLGHQCGMNEALSGWENLRFALAMMGVAWQDTRVQTVLEQLDVAAVAHRPVGRLSQGQRRRMALARVMLSERALWLLDEPDNALDAAACAQLTRILAAHAQSGGMAIVVSHRGIQLSGTSTSVLDLSAQPLRLHPSEAACKTA